MWRRRGQRGGDRPADHLDVDGVGGERPDRPAGQRYVGRSEPEHVFVGRPDQRPRARAVLLGDQVGQPAHHRDGDPQRLSLDQVRGGSDLVGHGGHGDLQDVAERVGLAAVVTGGGDACRADGVVSLPGPPGPAHRVGDDHPEDQAGPGVERLAEPPGRLVGILGQQDHGSGGRVGLVHPGRGQHETVPGLHDRGGAAPGYHPCRLRLDGLLAGGGKYPALRLADDLRGDDEDVTVAQVGGGVGDERRQVAARRGLRQPGNRTHRDGGTGRHASSTARSRAARAIAVVAGRSRMSSGMARTSMPASAGSSAAALSWSSTSQPSISSGP